MTLSSTGSRIPAACSKEDAWMLGYSLSDVLVMGRPFTPGVCVCFFCGGGGGGVGDVFCYYFLF